MKSSKTKQFFTTNKFLPVSTSIISVHSRQFSMRYPKNVTQYTNRNKNAINMG